MNHQREFLARGPSTPYSVALHARGSHSPVVSTRDFYTIIWRCYGGNAFPDLWCVPRCCAWRRFHSGRAPLRHCMQASTPQQVTIFILLFLLCAEQARSFVLRPSKTTKTPHAKGAYTHTTAAASTPRQGSTCDTSHPSTACPRPSSLPFAGTYLVGRVPSLCATADATTVMASETDMPVLRVLRVGEVPTLKADPVDPIAREQAKVRSRVARGQHPATSRH